MAGEILARVMAEGGFSMMPAEWLVELYELAQGVRDVPGAVVECGCYNGGSAVMLAAGSGPEPRKGEAAGREGPPESPCGRGEAERGVWLFDSWRGNPPPGKFDGDRARVRFFDELDGQMDVGKVSMVRKAFRVAGLVPPSGSPRGQGEGQEGRGDGGAMNCALTGCDLHLVRGWFGETVPVTETGPIALLHVDADWYKCVRQALELYERVVPGGLVIVHDYWCWPGAHRAVDELLERDRPPSSSPRGRGEGVKRKLGRVAKVGCWWVK